MSSPGILSHDPAVLYEVDYSLPSQDIRPLEGSRSAKQRVGGTSASSYGQYASNGTRQIVLHFYE